MSLPASVMEAMAAAGCSLEQIVATAKAHERDDAEKQANRREQNRIRQQNHRARNAASRVTDVTDVTESDDPSPKKETSPTPPKEKTTPSNSEAIASSNTPRAELETVLDSEHAAAVVEHRQRLRKPLTAYAARKLANSLSKAPDANAAADTMIANGWQGFDPSWLERRANSTAPPRGRRTFADVAIDKFSGQANGTEGVFGGHGDAEFVPPGRGESRPDDGNLRGGIGLRIVPSGR